MTATAPNEKHLHIVSRAAAKVAGLKRYFTGSECPNGSAAERRTNNGECLCDGCTASSRARKNAANKAFRLANRDTALRREREFYQRHRDRILEKGKAWREENRERLLAKGRKRNAERDRERASAWAVNNRDRHYANLAKRRATKRQAVPGWFSELDRFVMSEAYSLASLRSKTTGVRWDVDHMIPLACEQACGLHCATNIQVIPASLNLKKSNRLWLTEPGQWIGEL